MRAADLSDHIRVHVDQGAILERRQNIFIARAIRRFCADSGAVRLRTVCAWEDADAGDFIIPHASFDFGIIVRAWADYDKEERLLGRPPAALPSIAYQNISVDADATRVRVSPRNAERERFENITFEWTGTPKYAAEKEETEFPDFLESQFLQALIWASLKELESFFTDRARVHYPPGRAEAEYQRELSRASKKIEGQLEITPPRSLLAKHSGFIFPYGHQVGGFYIGRRSGGFFGY